MEGIALRVPKRQSQRKPQLEEAEPRLHRLLALVHAGLSLIIPWLSAAVLVVRQVFRLL